MRLGIIALLALAAIGCDANASRRDSSRETPVAADNTDRNDRDRNMDTLTPGDQAETDVDRTITQQIRQQVVGHDDLSITARTSRSSPSPASSRCAVRSTASRSER